jgi:putative ABC transport system ATP-binding protein
MTAERDSVPGMASPKDAGTVRAQVPPPGPENEGELEARQLFKTFRSAETEVRAVKGVDLTAGQGEVVLIMGPSGSEKTTLLSILGGLLRPDSGTVRIGNTKITEMSQDELTAVRPRLVGFVFQSFNLLSALTARENVEVAANLAGIRGASARTKAVSLLSTLGMQGRFEAKPRSLSGGEKQRVSIARALINAPAVILADEPTAMLDAKQGRAVAGLLREIAKEQNRTVVIVSHDERILETADRVL